MEALFTFVFLFVVWMFHMPIITAILACWHFGTYLALVAWQHPVQTVACVGLYLLIGAVWSIVKWYFVETERARSTRLMYERVNYNKKTWEEFAASHKTNLSSYRGDLMFWVATWPLNFIWTLFDDPFRKLCRYVVDELRGVYQRITDYAWR